MKTKPKTRKRQSIPPATAHQAIQNTILVIDDSGSMTLNDFKPSRSKAAKNSAKKFIEERLRIGAHNDKLAIVSYSSKARTECNLVSISHSKKLFRAIDGIQNGGATNIRAGLVRAEQMLSNVQSVLSLAKVLHWLENGENKSTDNNLVRRVILLTDGQHCYGSSPRPVAKRLKRAGTQIDCVGIAGCRSDVDEYLLKEIASIDTVTGLPRYRFIKDEKALIEHYAQLATGITR